MSYPSFMQGSRSTASVLDGVVFDRASNGSLRGRALWPNSKTLFKIEHMLTNVELAQLKTFYEANKASVFSFIWLDDGLTYEVVFKGLGTPEHLGGIQWKIIVELEEV